MSANDSKPFFKNLKETVGFINERVNKVRTAYSSNPTECSFSEVYQDLESRLNEIKDLKKEALNMKKVLEIKQDYFGNFLHDFQDLVLEMEEKVGFHEKYLQKFGYEPLEIKPIVEKEEIKKIPSEEFVKVIKTPSISDFLDIKQIAQFQNEKKKSEQEYSGSTPQLCFDQVFEKSSQSPELPNISDYPLNTDKSSSDCFDDYEQIARKLDF